MISLELLSTFPTGLVQVRTAEVEKGVGKGWCGGEQMRFELLSILKQPAGSVLARIAEAGKRGWGGSFEFPSRFQPNDMCDKLGSEVENEKTYSTGALIS